MVEHNALFRRVLNVDLNKVPKSTVIGIAAASTVLVVAIISICAFCFIRRRDKRAKAKRQKKAESIDRDADSPHDQISKTPLMRVESSSQIPEHHNSPAPRYDDEADIAMGTYSGLNRTLSDATVRSLPPSYLAATRGPTEGNSQTSPTSRHRPNSSRSGSDGLRPLMLVESQQHPEDLDRSKSRGRSRSGSTTKPGAPSLMPLASPGRPRAGSRFREEDLDM